MKTIFKIKNYIYLSLLLIGIESYAQIGRLPLSPTQKIEQNIGITDIVISYSRPSMKGRTIFGDLVPFDKLWRTGANRNTTISFNQDVIIGAKKVRKGKYAIFSKPNKKKWEVLLYTDTDNWDIPETIDDSKIVASITVPTQTLDTSKEVLSITIGDFTNYEFNLNIAWDKTLVSVPIKLTTKELMDTKINRVLTGPTYVDYYAAAEYQMEAGNEFEKGLAWINKAIEITDNVTWWDLRIKATLLMELGEFEASKKIAKEGLAMAEKKKRAYGINEFNKLLKKLEK